MKRRSKYGNRKTEVDGIVFDSKREAVRWRELQLLVRARKISCLSRQHVYELAPSVRIVGEKRARPALRYVADFRYLENGKEIIEDVKGFETPVWRVKVHVLKALHNIDVRVIR